ncbi:hypothetical protein D3C76_1824960 [compost metagenome]|nr:hypothetical protein R70331_02075 [Paenibacillus sp. FSL R7-0331]
MDNTESDGSERPVALFEDTVHLLIRQKEIRAKEIPNNEFYKVLVSSFRQALELKWALVF